MGSGNVPCLPLPSSAKIKQGGTVAYNKSVILGPRKKKSRKRQPIGQALDGYSPWKLRKQAKARAVPARTTARNFVCAGCNATLLSKCKHNSFNHKITANGTRYNCGQAQEMDVEWVSKSREAVCL